MLYRYNQLIDPRPALSAPSALSAISRTVKPLVPAQLSLNPDGTPWAEAYGDVYHSAAGALAQAEHVFLAGNELPTRWQGRERFVIVETGFGLGHNFLATWAAWHTDPQRCGQLHFVSVEKHPFSANDLASAHAAAQAPATLSAELLSRWPELVPGCHRIELANGDVVLTLLFGEAESLLGEAVARADAIYLDGFSPARNPEMWSSRVFTALASVSDSQTTLATWSVSGAIREGLQRVGFVVEKTEGFGEKREMLRGRHRLDKPRSGANRGRRAIVVGAGLAGTAIAERLARRGIQVHVIEAFESAAQGASGNLAGAFRPLPSKDDNRISRITRAGFLYGLHHLANLRDAQQEVLWEGCGVLHLARSTTEEGRQREVVRALRLPRSFLQWVDANEATRKAGHTASFGGWWFPTAGWIQPGSLCEANLAAGGDRIELTTRTEVQRIEFNDGEWHAFDSDDKLIDHAEILVLANAQDVRRLAGTDWLPLRAARGQVSHLPMAQLAPLGVVVCGQGYITPGIGGHAALGASFVVDDFDLALREDEHAENLAKLERMLPGFTQGMTAPDMTGRVSIRPVSIDRLPIVGALPVSAESNGHKIRTLPRRQGLWMISGFGARGLVWSSLCGELLAAQICGDPLPVERELADAMDPARFVISPPKHQRYPTE